MIFVMYGKNQGASELAIGIGCLIGVKYLLLPTLIHLMVLGLFSGVSRYTHGVDNHNVSFLPLQMTYLTHLIITPRWL